MSSNKKEDLFGLNNDSEEEDVSLDEEDQEDSRFTKARLQKQALSDNDSDISDASASEDEGSDVENEDEKEDENDTSLEEEEEEKGNTDSGDDDNIDGEGYDAPADLSTFGDEAGSKKKRTKSSKKIKDLSPEELEKFEKARKKTGVCYLSRIPPFMKPSRVRSLLSKNAEIGRIYLAPEDSKITAKRKKYTKNRRTNFTEGWVEFKDKKIARSTADYLNMKNIGGKRTSEYYHEMWNIKYLPKFKWHHLSEHMAHEKKAREQRLRNEIAQANRENKVYIQNVERAKMVESMEKKKRKREEGKVQDVDDHQAKVKRSFPQREKVNREVDPKKSGKSSMEKMDSNLKGVLGSIFAKK